MKISFIGGGVMGEAILDAILSAGIAKPIDVHISEPFEEKRTYLSDKYGVKCESSNLKVIENANFIILAIKPQTLGQVMKEISGQLTSNQTVISIIAGVTLNTLKTGLKHESVVRVMPNTPAQIRQGISVWTATDTVTKRNLDDSRAILVTLGEQIYVTDEKMLDMATALSGSGPAYVFLFIESLIDAGVYLGIPKDVATNLVLQTILGSTKMLIDTNKDPSTLKNMVTSPGGTTAEALLTMEEGSFKATIINAVTAAYEKSIWVFILAIVGRALMSFISPTGQDQISVLLIQVTEPILSPIRQFLPQSQIDFSPFIAIIILQILHSIVVRVL